MVHLKGNNAPINMTIVSIGVLNQSLVHPREMMKAAVLSNAASILMFHTHPSGSLAPSKDDVAITKRMQNVGMLMGIPVVDHIILGGNQSYYSFREKAILPMDELHYSTDLSDVDLKVAEQAAKGYGTVREESSVHKKKSIKESLKEKKELLAKKPKSTQKGKKKETQIE